MAARVVLSLVADKQEFQLLEAEAAREAAERPLLDQTLMPRAHPSEAG